MKMRWAGNVARKGGVGIFMPGFGVETLRKEATQKIRV